MSSARLLLVSVMVSESTSDQREVAVVQFPHPGREWSPDSGATSRSWTDWEQGHGRKFLRHPGQWLDGHIPRTGLLTFWGEWEGPSKVEPSGAAGDGMPTWLQTPSRGDLGSAPHPQNTDPFVFGAFLYSNCMQDHEWPKGTGRYRQTAVARLAPGSVILFGSTRGGSFELDTCFVVGRVIEIDNARFEEQVAGAVPTAFLDATLRPIFMGVGERRLSLYLGADFSDPGKPFCFVPCRPAGDRPLGFQRPRIQPLGALSDYVNPKSSRRFRRIPCDVAESEAAWHEVKRQVLDQAGLRLGIRLDPL